MVMRHRPTVLSTSGRSEHALRPGYHLAQWEIQQLIGEGGFSLVYQAIDKRTHQKVAIKEYFPSSVSIRNSQQEIIVRDDILLTTFNTGKACFHQEAEILQNLSHPNVPHYIDYINKNKTVYIITTYFEGINLKLWYQQTNKRLSQDWLIRFLLSLLEIVRDVHKEGYLHLDISWDNIQLQNRCSVILLDFGSACSLLQQDEKNTIILKPGFSPPELYYPEGITKIGTWSDIYSIGALAYALITGKIPPVSLVRTIDDNYQPLVSTMLEGYSADFLSLIDHALSLNIEDRPQTVEILIQQLNRVLKY